MIITKGRLMMTMTINNWMLVNMITKRIVMMITKRLLRMMITLRVLN